MNFIIDDYLKLDKEIGKKIARIIDKKEKLPKEEFKKLVTLAIGEKDEVLLTLLESNNFDEFVSHLPKNADLDLAVNEVKRVIERLDNLGIRNIRFDQTLMRGFDYYTGIVFEIFDNDPRNKRSLFGGGRYNDLLSIFGAESLPAFGFGMGDVTIMDALAIRGLLPEYKNPAKIAICIAEDVGVPYANDIAQKLRSFGINTVLDITGRKVGEQIKSADKKKIPFIVCIGGEEVKSGTLKVKELASGIETVIADDKLAAFLEKSE
jgi:histidyl-tRNA synthetase